MSLYQTSARFAEHADPACELRIIAADAKSLSVADRACLKEAADAHEELQRDYVRMAVELHEERQQHIALNERLLRLGSEIVALRDRIDAFHMLRSEWKVSTTLRYST